MLSFGRNSNIYCNDFSETYALPDGSLWMPIFYHDIRQGQTWFESEGQFLNTISEQKFSRLHLSQDGGYKNADGVYEFLLMYPDNSTSKYNRWTQTNKPYDATASGYKAIHIDYPGGGTDSFGALHKAANGSAYATCVTEPGHWFFSIGQRGNENGNWPTMPVVGLTDVKQVILFTRYIGNIKLVKNYYRDGDIFVKEEFNEF
jgi:hypothetical protein